MATLLQAPAPALATLLREARRLQRIQDRVREVLAAPLAEHVSVARADPATLVLAVHSPVWASRLRFRATDLLPSLRTSLGLPGLASVRVIVTPAAGERAPSARRAQVSAASATLLREVAGSVNDERLARVLRRLADRESPA